jgi:ABC-type transporter Mla subunit MlaD
MQPEAVSALNVIAIALAIQTLLMIACALAVLVAWRRVTVEADRRLADLSTRLDEVLRDTRTAAQAVGRVSDQANGLLNGNQGMVRTLAAAVGPSQALLAAGAASAASRLISRWRRGRGRVA